MNYKQLNKSDFVEWHKSDTAKRFAPPNFRSEKKATLATVCLVLKKVDF